MSGVFQRITKHTTDLAELAQRVRPSYRRQFDNFFAKSTKYVKDVNDLPPEAPAIDWSYYKKSVKPELQSMVDQFQCAYEAYKVPVPHDTLTALIEAEEAVVQKDITEFQCKSKERILQYNAEIDALKALLPFDQMTMEDFIDAYPEDGPDFLNRPTFWPHTRGEQPQAGAAAILSGEAHLLRQIMVVRERLTSNNVTVENSAKSEGDLALKPY